MITVIDYNTGNPNSAANMLKRIGYECKISGRVEDIKQSNALVLPGVGAFDMGMNNLIKLNLVDVLNEQVINKKVPIIGICLGMQLMCKKSEEGSMPGLGWFDSNIIKFKTENFPDIKIPHIGWNAVTFQPNSIFGEKQLISSKFYFAHAFHPAETSDNQILCHTTYGYSFVSGLQLDNIVGVQFHPEKSHTFGMAFLKRLFDKFLG